MRMVMRMMRRMVMRMLPTVRRMMAFASCCCAPPLVAVPAHVAQLFRRDNTGIPLCPLPLMLWCAPFGNRVRGRATPELIRGIFPSFCPINHFLSPGVHGQVPRGDQGCRNCYGHCLQRRHQLGLVNGLFNGLVNGLLKSLLKSRDNCYKTLTG